MVTAGEYDLGIAFDGDADRCLMIDEKGNVVDGDKTMAVCGLYMRDPGSEDSWGRWRPAPRQASRCA